MSTRVKPGTPGAAIVEEEENLHRTVQARAALGDSGGVIGEGRVHADHFDKELLELRDAIAEAKPEDLAPLVEQMTRMAAIRGRLGGSQSLPVDVRSPYFAHMVLAEKGKRRDVLIGKRGFIDRKAGVQIVDWRNAPISQVYYRYDEGDDYDEEVGGQTFSGVVEVRRNLSISGARLRRIGAPQGTFVCDADNQWWEAVGSAAPVLQGGAGKAARAPRPVAPPPEQKGAGKGRRARQRRPSTLGVHSGPIQRADKHLPEIAALIDREQFDLITQPEGGLVVIQGGAGSGKTTVALHRIAYLAFADRRRFAAKKILFVVPSRALARYVKDVLPSLGVTGVPVVTYASWARNTRQRLIPGTGGKYNDDTPDAVSRLKKHPLLLTVMDAYVRDKAAEVEAELEELAEAAGSGDAALVEWRANAKRALVPRLRAVWRGLKSARMPAPDRVRLESAVKRLGGECADIHGHWAELLTDRARLQALIDAGAATRAEVERLVSWCAAQQDDVVGPADPDGSPIESVDGRSLTEGLIGGQYDVEDDPILLRLVQLFRGGLITRDGNRVEYAHVAIDEAQDRSALEVKVLVECTAGATPGDAGDPAQRSVTIAGDTAQRVVFDNHFDSWQQLLEHIGHSAAVIRPLKLSYRSTAEVMALANEVLGPELRPQEPLVARNGAPVEVHEFSDVGEAVAFLGDALRGLVAREPSASVAVVARYPEQADAYYAGLSRAEVPSLRRVRSEDFSFEAGVDVTDAAQVKGLEFDYTILVDVNASTYPPSVEARHLLHIGATRAAHQLWLISTSELSPLIPTTYRFHP